MLSCTPRALGGVLSCTGKCAAHSARLVSSVQSRCSQPGGAARQRALSGASVCGTLELTHDWWMIRGMPPHEAQAEAAQVVGIAAN